MYRTRVLLTLSTLYVFMYEMQTHENARIVGKRVAISRRTAVRSPMERLHVGVLSGNIALARAADQTWAPRLRASGASVFFYVDYASYRNFTEAGVTHVVPLAKAIVSCGGGNCHASYALVRGMLTHALRTHMTWRHFVRLDDDVAVCPRATHNLAHALARGHHDLGGYWIVTDHRRLKSRIYSFPDEHALIMSRRFGARVVAEGTFDASMTFDMQAVYWATLWRLALFDNLLDIGFCILNARPATPIYKECRSNATPLSAGTVCQSRYAFFHRVKSPTLMAQIDFDAAAVVNETTSTSDVASRVLVHVAPQRLHPRNIFAFSAEDMRALPDAGSSQ